ncbi:MAG: hypothetical protein M0024_09925 [Nitrospiraceae bacterium]|nr:hypothetical protein [Nitrospiraceae bacterium]
MHRKVCAIGNSKGVSIPAEILGRQRPSERKTSALISSIRLRTGSLNDITNYGPE